MKSLNCRVFCFTWFQSVNFNHLLKYEDSLAEIRTIEVDFFYFDLSRGGKVEKDTGADLGFIIVIDLPDYPFTVKSVILQAKKINGNVQINGNQYETLNTFNKDNCAYLFYDMNYQTLSSPIVLKLDDYDFKKGYEVSKEKVHNSFSMDFKAICDGDPLSIFLLSTIIYHKGSITTSIIMSL